MSRTQYSAINLYSILMKSSNALPALVAILLTSLFSCTNRTEQGVAKIYLLPIGPTMPAGKITLVQNQLRESYKVPVAVLPAMPLPDSAFYPPRQRYRAQAILNHIAAAGLKLSASPYKIVALTTEDVEVRLSPAKPHWGVMGLANGIGGQQAVVSLHRMAGKDARLRNVAVHETGHLLGLRHCSGPEDNRCVMRDAKGSGAIVDRCMSTFCAVCSQKRKL